MRGKPVTKTEIKKIKHLRKIGYSFPEICRVLKRRSSTVYRFARDVVVLPEYIDVLRQKQGGSKKRADKLWKKFGLEAEQLLKKIGKKERLFILAAIYWGEGTKKELGLINSDPKLIQVFVACLKEIGVQARELKISIRIYTGIDINEAKKYWARICGIKTRDILKVNILEGKKVGKLPYGMCRVRVTKSGNYFKLIISMIEFIKSQIIK